MELTTLKRLSLGARALLQLLSEQSVWRSQKEIAEALGRSVRSVQLYLRELRGCGLIQEGRSYVVVCAAATPQNLAPAHPLGTRPRETPAPLQRPVRPASVQVQVQPAPQNSAVAAEAEVALSRHLPRQTVMAYGLCRDPELALAAVRLYESRLRGPPATRPRSVGFLIEAVRRPSEFGLVRHGSSWVDQEDLRQRRAQEMARQEMAEKIQAQRQAAEAQRRAAEAEYARKKAVWDSLPPQRQDAICAQVRRQYPLLGQGWLFQWACLEAAFEQRTAP